MKTEGGKKLPRVKAVKAVRKQQFTLNVEWSDNTRSRVDMTGLIYTSRHFRTFQSDPASFAAVTPDEFGSGIEWENGLDYAAATLRMMADEQQPLTGKDLMKFQHGYRLNIEEMARMFGVSTRTIRYHRKSRKPLPAQFGIALRRFESDATAFAAHFRPVEKNPPGRPRANNP